MSWVAAAVVGGSVIGGVLSANAQEDAANTAANAQTQSNALAEAGVQRRFDHLQSLFKPFVDTGTSALFAQGNLIGLNGGAPQQAAIDAIRNGPQFQAMLAEGENSILQNASATGGLRGGNTQAALARYSPLLLANLVQQQYQNLGGLTSIGQNAAAGVGNAGMNVGNTIAQLQQSTGAAQAGAALAGGRAEAGLYNSLGSAVGLYGGLGGFGKAGGFGGGGSGNTYQSIVQNSAIDPLQYANNYG